MKKAYFIGIAGKTMGQLAKAFKDLGWRVSGSDQEKIYPPVSTYLKKNALPCFKGYSAKNVPADADLIVVGRGALIFDPGNPEYRRAKKENVSLLSYPEVLQKFLIKENSIVVAGTYGKTTISAAIAWILIKAGLNPSYMVGGIPLNMKDGVAMTNSSYSVVEGDEPPALKETDLPKFMFYKPKYLVLTATAYDHPEIFKSYKDYLAAFVKLVKLLPQDGFLIYNRDKVDEKVIRAVPCRKVSYSLDAPADYFVKEVSRPEKETNFVVQGNKESFFLQTVLLGKRSLENFCGAVALCAELGIGKPAVAQGIKSFLSVKTRLEYLGRRGERYLYWDFAQHPEKVRGSLGDLREHFPNKRIFCVFDPSMTGLKHRVSLNWYKEAFDQADQVIVGKVSFRKNIDQKMRVTGKDIAEAIARTQKNVFYEPIDEQIIEYLLAKTGKDDVVVFMSSGGLRFTNLIEKTATVFENKNQRYEKIINILGKDRIKLNEPLSKQMTFNIGGPADLFYEAKTERELIRVIKVIREEGIPYFILAGGSNILVGDKGFRGIVIKFLISNFKFLIKDETVLVTVGAGMLTSVLLNELAKRSISGLEFMAGVPGTVGGAVRGNAGAWQQNFGDKVSRVKVLTSQGEIVWLRKTNCQFKYRHSRFKKSEEIILEVELRLDFGDKEKMEKQIKGYLERRVNQPREPSAGSVFINPRPQAAGELIEQCGLKGKRIGGAQISKKHANFIVNVKDAKAADVLALIEVVKVKVREKFNIDLNEEIVKIGEF